MSGIEYSTIGENVAVLRLDNPPANALGHAMRVAFNEKLDELERGDAIRALIVTGTGRSFCSGDDLKEQQAARAQGKSGHLGEFARLLDRIEAFRVPVIAAINGWCLGGGLELALCCDIRIASTSATFTCAGVNVGLMASAYRLPRLIGVALAKQMLLTGSPHDAATAERFGLVTAVHAPDALMDEAAKLAQRIASRAPLSVEATKRAVGLAPDLSPEEAAKYAGKELSVLAASADHAEALAAFAAKREPQFHRK
jgi:enoyl-CoA hydratase/carnithine racemase